MSIAAEACNEVSSKAGSSRSVSLRVSVLSDARALGAVRGQLEELAGDLCEPNVFYESWMLEPAIRHLGEDLDFELVCIHCADGGQRLCGFFPLVRVPLHGALPFQLYSLWQHAHCFRCTPLIRRGFADRCWAALFDWLRDGPLNRRLLRIERLSQRMEEEVDHGGKCQEMGIFSWEISETKKFILFSQWEFQDPKIRGTVNHIFCHILWLYPLT